MRPKLQIALDTKSLEEAFRPLNRAIDQVDIIEVGTILIINEGLRAVREIRALYPAATILADVRIAEAGSIISRDCFAAGASWVSCVSGASLTTIAQVVKVAQEFDGEVQVELGETYDTALAQKWYDLGVKHVIAHRSRDAEASGNLSWGPDDIKQIRELSSIGFTVTITGGISAAELDAFAGVPVSIIIAGRSIVKAENPENAAKELQDTIKRVWP